MNTIEQLQAEALQAWSDSGKTWNNGKFADNMEQLFIRNSIDIDKGHKILEKAFTFYMAGNSPSEQYINNAMVEIHNIGLKTV